MRRVITVISIILLVSGCGLKSVFHREPPPVESEVVREADWKVDFNDVYFFDAKNGWIIGNSGTIILGSPGQRHRCQSE